MVKESKIQDFHKNSTIYCHHSYAGSPSSYYEIGEVLTIYDNIEDIRTDKYPVYYVNVIACVNSCF